MVCPVPMGWAGRNRYVFGKGLGQAKSDPLDEAMCKVGCWEWSCYPFKGLEKSKNLVWTTKDRALRAGCSRWRRQHMYRLRGWQCTPVWGTGGGLMPIVVSRPRDPGSSDRTVLSPRNFVSCQHSWLDCGERLTYAEPVRALLLGVGNMNPENDGEQVS